MGNRLAGETSPYLLEHADNPVDWFPWGDEALAMARTENKPILLSIGYSACHWCHVMARESFEDPAIAAQMNRDFVNIKVDREERPDLDQVYMRAVQGMTGSGGWPMTVFLLPDGTPFFAGTYFPADDRFGMPSFGRVLTAVAAAFSQRPTEIEGTAAQVREFLERPSIPLASGALTPALLDEATQRLERDYDPVHGGFGGAPKFPQPMLLEFLLRAHRRTGDANAVRMATHTLQAMAAGGMYDQLGGGFHRYSVDDRWLVPHFEKMLYDNALLARAYLDAWRLTHDPAFERTVNEILSFVQRELTSPEGGFYSSLDADSEGEEGRFYVWTPAELEAVLGSDRAASIGAALDVTAAGNFEGKNILHPVTSDAIELLAQVRAPLMAARDQRRRPHRDEKVLAGWNGLMLRAFADAGRLMHRLPLISAAESNARFLLGRMRVDGRMRRSYKDGRTTRAGYLEDQASVADGLLSLYAATFDAHWLNEMSDMVEAMLAGFWDEERKAFFDTGADHERLVVRPQEVTDNALPSGTSLAVDVLLRGGSLMGRDDWIAKARTMLERLAPTAAKAPLAFGRLLASLDFALAPPVELALIGNPAEPGMKRFAEVAAGTYLPNLLLAGTASDGNPNDLPLLRDRRRIGGQPTAYLCEGFVCQAPTADAAELKRQLGHLERRPVRSS